MPISNWWRPFADRNAKPLVHKILLMTFLAAAGTTDVLNSETGQREGRIVEGPGSNVDVFDAESNRTGWGRRNADGSVELSAPDGQRLGTITPGQGGNRTLWLNAPGKGGGKR